MKAKDLIEQLKKHVELEQLYGVQNFDRAVESAEKQEDMISLNELKKEVSTCQQCSLSKTRTNVVFGEGSDKADLVFVGEAPGEDEDIMGRPFVGKAGQLLTKIIENGMKIKRSDVYICNILKCRPPNKRDPLPEEVEKCEQHLLKQLKMDKPKSCLHTRKICNADFT